MIEWHGVGTDPSLGTWASIVERNLQTSCFTYCMEEDTRITINQNPGRRLIFIMLSRPPKLCIPAIPIPVHCGNGIGTAADPVSGGAACELRRQQSTALERSRNTISVGNPATAVASMKFLHTMLSGL